MLKNICEFLDRGGLMNLRLTSRHLKATVEQPTHLEKLPVKVVCSKQLQRIIQSNVPFNNFNLSFSSIEEQSYLNEFAVRFGSNIKILKIRSAGGHHKIAKLLEKCVQIRELELERMCPSVLTASDNTELFKTMLYNFRNLDKLIIHNFQDQNVSGVIAVNTFLRILKNCKRLRYFNIPFMDKYNEKLALQRFQRVQAGVEENIQVHNQENNNALIEEEENWEEDQPFPMRNDPLPEWNPDSDHDILIHPIIDYIITRRIGNKCDKIRQIDVDSRNYFELLPRSMRDLLQVSLKEEISILNINSNKLSYIVNEVKQWNAEYWRVVKSASVTNLFSGFSLSDLQNVEELNFVVHPRANPSTRDFRMTEDSYIWPKLKSVCVKLLGENNPVVVDRLIKEIERPTITKLHLEWCVLGPCKTVLGKNLHHNFPNLRELAMNGWDGTDDEFCTIWRDMKKLEVIHLRDCKYLSNRSFEGMCNLKSKICIAFLTNIEIK